MTLISMIGATVFTFVALNRVLVWTGLAARV
jgi:hypothetical protein